MAAVESTQKSDALPAALVQQEHGRANSHFQFTDKDQRELVGKGPFYLRNREGIVPECQRVATL